MDFEELFITNTTHGSQLLFCFFGSWHLRAWFPFWTLSLRLVWCDSLPDSKIQSGASPFFLRVLLILIFEFRSAFFKSSSTMFYFLGLTKSLFLKWRLFPSKIQIKTHNDLLQGFEFNFSLKSARILSSNSLILPKILTTFYSKQSVSLKQDWN